MKIPFVESFGISDIGTSRSNNEDVWGELPDEHFYVLADGMGGHLAGEVAAKEGVLHLCDSIERFLRVNPNPTIEMATTHLKNAFSEANRWIRSLTEENHRFAGMGTTLCCVLLLKNEIVYGHIGDSRIYRFRKQLERLTEDHTLKAELLAAGEITKQMSTRYKNVLTRALGIAPFIQPDIHHLPYQSGDIYLLSSDGLHESLSDFQIEAILRETPSIKNAAIELVEAAKNAGSTDNITALVILCH